MSDLYIPKPMLGQLPNPAAPGREGLAAEYWLNEGKGNRVQDGSGNGNPGTITGAVWNGSELYFDGSDHFVTKNLFDLSLGGTIVGWIRVDNVDSDRAFASIEGGGDVANFQFQIWADNAATDYWAIGIHSGGAWSVRYGTKPVVANQWYCVGMTYAAGVGKLYVDGVQEGADLVHTAQSISKYVWFGENESGAKDLIGSICHAGIYNRALTAGEFQQLYINPKRFLGYGEEARILRLAGYTPAGGISIPVVQHHRRQQGAA